MIGPRPPLDQTVVDLSDADSDLSATIRDVHESTSATSSSSSRVQRVSKRHPLAAVQGDVIDRYQLEELAGSGATSQVFAASDQVFDRRVAIKFLHGAKAEDPKRLGRFVREAKLTAALEHPNIAPIYDLDVSDEGVVYFTMRLINGSSLGVLLAAQKAGVEVPQIATIHQKIEIFLKVIDAISSAHHRGILHRDIKPENIMIGAFGEVFLVDWGCALHLDEQPAAIPHPPRMVGTPNYMSPEQARCDEVHVTSDVYALGATLFEMLLGRVPLIAGTKANFWQEKRQGRMSPVSQQERRLVPRHLLAICLRALQVDPTLRYESAEMLGEDIRAWEAGLSVQAYRENIFEWCERWHRRYWRVAWLSAAVLAVVLSGVTYIWGEHLKAVATWGTPQNVYNFSQVSELEDWVIGSGKWVIADGHLLAQGKNTNVLWYKPTVTESVAIEFTGRMSSTGQPGDLSVLWSPNEFEFAVTGNDETEISTRDRSYFQFGAYDNSYALLRVRNRFSLIAPLVLNSDRDYRIRVELDGEMLRMMLDGKVILSHRSHLPLGTGHIALYGYYPGKSFDNLSVYTKGMPERVSALAAGNRDLTDGLYERAANHFANIAEVHAGKPIADEALFREGMAWWMSGQPDRAEDIWVQVIHPRWRDRIAALRIEGLIANGDYVEALAELRVYCLRQGADLEVAAGMWSYLAGSGLDQPDAYLRSVMQLRDEMLDDKPVTDAAMARLLLRLNDYDQLTERFPHIVNDCTQALIVSGRAPEVLLRYPEHRYLINEALLALGHYDDILRNPNAPNWSREAARFFTDRLESDNPLGQDRYFERWLNRGQVEPIAEFSQDAIQPGMDTGLQWAHLLLGRERLMVERIPLEEWNDTVQQALVLQDAWYEDAELRELCEAQTRTVMREAVALKYLQVGRVAEADEIMRPIIAKAGSGFVIGPLLENDLFPALYAWQRGDPGVWDQILATWLASGQNWGGQRPYYMAAWFTGAIDDRAFLQQPMGLSADSCLAFLHALRADWRGQSAQAQQAYATYLARPAWKRTLYSTQRSTIIELWVRNRLADLSARPESAVQKDRVP